MLYTGINEIDSTLGELKNGELTVVTGDYFADPFFEYILFNLAKQTDKNNRQNISNYDEKMQFIANYEDVKLEVPVEIISVLGRPQMEYNVLSTFPMNSYKQEEFDLLKKQIVLFNNLPIQQSFCFPSRRSAKLLIKDILNYCAHCIIPNKISALCVSGWLKQLPLLKEVAQTLNIPVIVFEYVTIESIAQKFKSKMHYIDKLVIIEDNYYKKEYSKLFNPETTTFTLKNLKTNQSSSIISNYHPQVFFEIYDEFYKNHSEYTNCYDILTQMARNENYINKYNFTKYMNLPQNKNEYFWAYIEVFQRIEIEDLYEFIAEYKKSADKQELWLATTILRKLLIGEDEDRTEQISISAKPPKLN